MTVRPMTELEQRAWDRLGDVTLPVTDLCLPCRQAWDAWTDYPGTPAPLRLHVVDNTHRGAVERRREVAAERYHLVRYQQRLIRSICQRQHAAEREAS